MPSRTLGLKLEDDDPWDVEQAIFDILVDVLEPNSTLSLHEAALKLDALFPTNRSEQGKPKESPESFLWEFWGRVVKTAQQIAHDSPTQDQLVDLVLALKSLDNPQTLEIWGCKVQLWTDLPILGPEITETWNCESCLDLCIIYRASANVYEQPLHRKMSHRDDAGLGSPPSSHGWLRIRPRPLRLSHFTSYGMLLRGGLDTAILLKQMQTPPRIQKLNAMWLPPT